METDTELIMNWVDEFLKWDPSRYGGTETVVIPYDQVWFPDIVLLNV